MRRLAASVVLMVATAAACAPGAGAAPALAAAVHVARACFSAAGPDGKSYNIFARRYTAGAATAARSAPAIVLVHGVASTADIWDLTPRWSVARRLAAAGYVVFTYDRLGYRYSPYPDPSALTVSAQQVVLHDIVSALHTKSYKTGSCSGPRAAFSTKKVAIVGHSGGGFIVSSYPGRFHDVAAMVQANAPSGLASTSPAGNAAILSATAPAPHGAQDDVFGPVGDASLDGPAPTPIDNYTYAPGPARASCEEFDLWRPGAVPAAATPLCNPANDVGTPAAETASYPTQALQTNPKLIAQTGTIPVLLAGTDHDAVMPGNANMLEYSAWRERCSCDVSHFILNNTGHAFMAHQSLPSWITHVTTWLRTKDLKP